MITYQQLATGDLKPLHSLIKINVMVDRLLHPLLIYNLILDIFSLLYLYKLLCEQR